MKAKETTKKSFISPVCTVTRVSQSDVIKTSETETGIKLPDIPFP